MYIEYKISEKLILKQQIRVKIVSKKLKIKEPFYNYQKVHSTVVINVHII